MVTINEQAFLFLTCVKIGIIMGILYDGIRVLRKIIHHPNWMVQIEDLLYWIACGWFAFIMIFWRNFGQIRVFVFLGILIGGVLYFATVSSFIRKIITKVIKDFVLFPIKCIINIMGIPIKYVLRLSAIMNKTRKKHRDQVKNKLSKGKKKVINQLRIMKAKK